MSAHEKVAEIFREIAGNKADRLSATHFPADVNSRITRAIAASNSESDILSADHIGFHLVDWQTEPTNRANGVRPWGVGLTWGDERLEWAACRDCGLWCSPGRVTA